MKFMAIAAAFLGWAWSLPGYAGEDCIAGVLKTDMCADARKLADGVAPMLPMRMSQNMTWESVAAFGRTIQAHVRLSYDRRYLEGVLKTSGAPLSQAERALEKAAQNVCQQRTPTRAFVQRGGKFRYVYLFSDGEQFTSIPIDRCE